MRKHILLIPTVIVVLAALFNACKDDPSVAPLGEAIIRGVIIDGATGDPLDGVTVQAQSVAASVSDITDAGGNYELRFSLDSAASVTVTMGQKSGYRDTAFTVAILSGQALAINASLSRLSPVSGGTGSGEARTIAFLGADPQQISVYGVGGDETAILGFQVRDSLGLPIDANNAVTLVFTVNGGLGGGEYVSPPTVLTNASGQAYTTFNSGIRSGVVQIVATTQVGNPPRTITSAPIRVIINAGFPDKTHFSLAPTQLNIPALHVFGMTDAIGVIVGDIYSNPVVANTAVYMSTMAGVIIASIFTDETGRGSADLISGNPRPYVVNNNTTPDGDGYHYVFATTIGQNGQPVKDTTVVLWSGFSQITNFVPPTIDVPNGSSQAISFTVSDENGNPLSLGTTISVSATGVQASTSFGIGGALTLGDILYGGTQFTCFVIDFDPDSSYISGASLTVTVMSPNGNVTSGISGIIR